MDFLRFVIKMYIYLAISTISRWLLESRLGRGVASLGITSLWRVTSLGIASLRRVPCLWRISTLGRIASLWVTALGITSLRISTLLIWNLKRYLYIHGLLGLSLIIIKCGRRLVLLYFYTFYVAKNVIFPSFLPFPDFENGMKIYVILF